VFVLDEVQGNFVKVVAKLFEQFGTDNDSFEHNSTWTNLTKKDEVSFAFSGVDLFF
jgi:hypothetical protein